MNIDLSIVIVNFNTRHLLKDMFDCLYAAAGRLSIQYIIVDNASVDDSVEWIRTNCPSVRLLVNESNIGFGRANNKAIPFITGAYVLLLNTDAFVSEDTLEKTLSFMKSHARCGVLGVKLLGRDDQLQPSCRYFPTPWNIFLNETGLVKVFKGARMVDDMQWDHASIRQCDWVPGCYYLMRKEVIDQVGLFDPRYFLYYEEIDHCRAVKQAGWEIIFFPGTQVVHIGGESAKSEGDITTSGRQLEALQIESELLYFRKNHGLLAVISNVLLATLANFINLAKSVVKMRGRGKFPFFFRKTVLLWSLLNRTRIGLIPTR